ncbi:MAG: ATP-binding protein, partial [bacterium]|nr:ATP-binding protein [bacterium]
GEDVERLFEPFVKLDPARGHRSGYGLGLNLCRRIVEVHRGSIRMLPNRGRGTRVQVILPRTTCPDEINATPRGDLP